MVAAAAEAEATAPATKKKNTLSSVTMLRIKKIDVENKENRV